jgi:hypothetical protein
MLLIEFEEHKAFSLQVRFQHLDLLLVQRR